VFAQNITIDNAITALRMNDFPQCWRIPVLARPVTVVTMTCGWVQDMIRASGIANEELEGRSFSH
jgi:hypothetical protein